MSLLWRQRTLLVRSLTENVAKESQAEAPPIRSPKGNKKAANAQDYLGKVMNFGNRLGFTPYKYDYDTHLTLYDSGVKAKILFGANCLAVLLYQAFTVPAYILTLMDPEAKAENQFLGGYLCVVSVGLNVLLYIFAATYGKLHHVWNELMRNAAELKLETEESLVTSMEESKIYQSMMEKRNLIVIIGGAIATGVPVVTRGLKVLRRPNSFGLVSSAFENPEGFSFGTKLLLALLQLNISGFNFYSLYLSGAFVITYSCSVLPIVQDTVLRSIKGPNWKLEQMGRTISKVNTRLMVFQATFNSIFKLYPLALQLIGLVAIITRLFLAVKLRAAHHLFAGIVMLATMLLFFIGFAEIHEMSEEALKSWVGLRKPRWFSKYVRSCRSMRVSVGDFFYADKSLVLTIISIVIDNTTNLVLTMEDFGQE